MLQTLFGVGLNWPVEAWCEILIDMTSKIYDVGLPCNEFIIWPTCCELIDEMVKVRFGIVI